MSGFVANEMSAFTTDEGSLIFSRRKAADVRFPFMISKARSYPQPISRSLCEAWREMVVDNSGHAAFLSSLSFP